ncbi:MAG: D-alanyl-D-alanine carboxypeptidase family protein [Sulfitobacter sp.]
MTRIFAAVLCLIALPMGAFAFETRATAAYVIDQTTGTVLLAKNADEPLPPASMSKLMTLYMAFEAVDSGRLDLDQELPVSQHAMSYGGSTLFLKAGERVSVEDLLRGIIVLSGNDACVVIAEALSGTEAKFARDMTTRAVQMGMSNSTFTNSNGWPKAGHRMSMRDLGLLAHRLIADYPQFYPMFAEKEFLFDETESQNRYNRNPLLTLGIGADGLKTGHTSEAGYGLVGSAKQGDRRVIFVISGLETAQARAQESEAIVNWAFRQFAQKTMATEGQKIAEAEVTLGAEKTVGLVTGEDVSLLVPAINPQAVQANVVYNGPIPAPITAGDELAKLVITREDLPEVTVPLYADRSIAPYGFADRLGAAALHLLARINQGPAPETTPAADPA